MGSLLKAIQGKTSEMRQHTTKIFFLLKYNIKLKYTKILNKTIFKRKVDSIIFHFIPIIC
jgi:predicted cupin superfamily sugar epimerase